MTKLPTQMALAFSAWLIEQMRERDNMTQSELAKASGLTRQAISYYLSAKSKQPDEFALQKIAEALDLPVEEVYRAAGILPPKIAKSDLIERILNLFEDLPPEEQENVMEYVKMRQRLINKRSKKKK